MHKLILLCTVQHRTCAYIHMGNIDIVTLNVREATYKYWGFQHDMVIMIIIVKERPYQELQHAEHLKKTCNQFHCKGALFIIRFIESLNTYVCIRFLLQRF